jgi:hypothetical protein
MKWFSSNSGILEVILIGPGWWSSVASSTRVTGTTLSSARAAANDYMGGLLCDRINHYPIHLANLFPSDADIRTVS